METPRYDVPLPMTLGEAITIIEDVHNWDYDTDTATALGMFQDEGGLHTPVTLTLFEKWQDELAGYEGVIAIHNRRTGTLTLCGHDCPLYLKWHDPATLSPQPQQPTGKLFVNIALTKEDIDAALNQWKAQRAVFDAEKEITGAPNRTIGVISFTPNVFDLGR